MITKLPTEYIQYVNKMKLRWGETDLDFGGYFDLEPLENIEQMNKDIEIEKYAPGFTAFVSDGGGEVFVFDEAGQIFLLPLIGMEQNTAVKIASSWNKFESHIKKNA